MKIYSFDEFNKDCINLAKSLKNVKIDAIVGIARGGLSLAQFLSHLLNIKACFSINSSSYENDKKVKSPIITNIPKLYEYKNILIVDDIVDSGESLQIVLNTLNSMYKEQKFITATLFYKEKAIIKPDFYIHLANEWIKFYWEYDLSEFC